MLRSTGTPVLLYTCVPVHLCSCTTVLCSCTAAQVSVVRTRSRVAVAQQHGSLTSGAGRRVQWVSPARPQAAQTHGLRS